MSNSRISAWRLPDSQRQAKGQVASSKLDTFPEHLLAHCWLTGCILRASQRQLLNPDYSVGVGTAAPLFHWK